MQASKSAVVALAALLVAGASPALGQTTGEANVSRAVSEWSKTTKKAHMRFVAEGIVVEDAATQSAYGQVGLTSCPRRMRGPRTCIGASMIKPLDEGSFQVADDLSSAQLEMAVRGRDYLIQWRSDEEDSVEPGIRSIERGRADVERDASASGEFYGSTVATTQLEAAAIQQVVDLVPQELPVPFPFPFLVPNPLAEKGLAGSTSCWNYKPAERGFAKKMNEERAKQGLGKLRLDPELSKVSRVHTAEMIKADLLHHATTAQLTRRVTDWTTLGENVGVGGTVLSLHDAFMNSPAHKANILFGFNHVGVGVAKSNGRMWVTVTFAKSPNPGTSLSMPRC